MIGTTKIKNLDNNIGSLEVKLAQADLREIRDAVPIDEVGGKREIFQFGNYSWEFANTPPKS